MRRSRYIFRVAALCMLWASGAVAQTKPELDTQLAQLMQMLPGEYDNAVQIKRQNGEKPFFPVHTIIKPVAMPEVGEHVLYLEEYRDNDPAKLIRIRLYKFNVEENAKAIRLHLVNPLKPEALIGAHKDIAKIEALTLADMRVDRDVCDVFIRKNGAEFRGAMKENACNRPDQTVVDYTLIVGPNKHWVRNRARSMDTGAVAWEFVPGAGENFIEQFKLP
ncbi:MAG: hypothetical protein EXR11_12630 [Rhodospirillaceae bacterium]|nr:hypothetical protein [Rhodospirillaceae bacterium]